MTTNRSSSGERGWTRRGVVAACFAVLAGLWLLVSGRWSGEEVRSADPLVGVLRSPQAAARVGNRVLAEYPAWNDPGSLRRELEWGLDGRGNLAEQLARKLQGDFEAGRVVRVDGWILGFTEARIYALASLVP